MYVPVHRDKAAIGVLSIQSYTLKAYDEKDLQTLQALADHCGGALERIRVEQENDRLQRELRRHAEELEGVNAGLELRVRERTAQLEAINKELEAFCYSVSHDLRAPLRSIRGFSEVLLERHASQLDPRGQDYLRRACQACHQMDRLIEDLLQLSRVGRAEMQRQTVNLSAVAGAIAAELHKAEPERRVEFIIAGGLTALGDERLLRVVLENLLRNAWKFTSKRPLARIEFGAHVQPSRVYFMRDNGVGFDPDYSDKMFGVFQRLHSASEFPGTGVGLAIVQRIINRHGGRIWAEARPGEGATFYFSLPANAE
jgi:light-regulated signal transduction histidine kinase (bacteriophytochrome)